MTPAPLRLMLLLSVLLLPAGGCTGSGSGTGDDGDRTLAAGGAARGASLPPIRPDHLVGFDADRLTATLGPADFRRADGPAEIWQYRDATCVLDLFLYGDPTAGGLRVEHVEVRDRAATPLPGSDCAGPLLRERQLQAASG